ncbi:MAG: AMP-binding protein [Gammaproteobacteria bacterium]|nr:AMP-binding protein [Gammaproteobacteria bacterium]
MSLLDSLLHCADERPALAGPARAWTRRELAEDVAALARRLKALEPQAIALLADNGADWVLVDLAAAEAGIPLVPLPPFFTPAQMRHVLDSAGVDCLLGAPPALALVLGFAETRNEGGVPLPVSRRIAMPVELPAGTAKISFTSGTTGAPKGVCLSLDNQLAVARSLVAATTSLRLCRHLCLLPFAVLLENIAGVYAPLLAGAECRVAPLAELGLTGASGFDPAKALAAIRELQAESLILLPQMLHALVHALEFGAPRPESLRFIAVGGARVPLSLLERTERLGLPVYEGYGLSECASVVALNTPEARRLGSVGRVLPHARVRIEQGELFVEGNAMLGYLGQAEAVPSTWPTGDLGRVDSEGFLYLAGRRKNLLISSYGRNISPEWPEAELSQQPAIAQAAVFGDSRPFCTAVLVPRHPELPDAALAAAVAEVNAGLPDYAQIRRYIRADAPFSPNNGQLTANGRVRREAVAEHYAARLDALHDVPALP